MPGNFYYPTPEQIEAWPTPNYDNPPTRSWLPAFTITWQVVSTILVAGRFYLRSTRKAGAFGFDDCLILFAWVFSVAFTTVACLDSVHYGVDRHTWDVRPDLYVKAALVGWLAQVFFLFSTFGIKLSVLLFYRRMVKDTVSRTWLYTLWVFIFITCAAYLGVFITYCTICEPLDAYWKAYSLFPPYKEKYHCINGADLDIASGVLLGVSDVWSVVIPCLMLRHYQLDVTSRQKWGLNLIFSLGLLATGAGIARTYWLWQISHTPDVFNNGFWLFVWSSLECHLGLICACLPSLRAFFRYYFGDPTRRTVGSGTRSNQDSQQRESRRWSKRNTKDSWVTELNSHRGTRDSLPSPREKHSTDIMLFHKASTEELG